MSGEYVEVTVPRIGMEPITYYADRSELQRAIDSAAEGAWSVEVPLFTTPPPATPTEENEE